MSDALRQELVAALKKAFKPHLENFHSFRVTQFGESVQVNVEYLNERHDRALLLKVNVPDQYPQVEIPNILLPVSMQHQGIGKQLMRLVQQIAQRHGRRTFVSDLTAGFYRRLTGRGAIVVEPNEVVEIVDATRLE